MNVIEPDAYNILKSIYSLTIPINITFLKVGHYLQRAAVDTIKQL
jgi:hypothetical protein